MEDGSEFIAPQYRERAGIAKTKPEGRKNQALPDSHDPDPTKAALVQPVSKSRVAAAKQK